MVAIQELHKTLLKEYPRAIVHMRAQLQAGRFSLLFGAGLGKPFGLPGWSSLVDDIAADSKVKGQGILQRFSDRGSLPYKTELLFQHYRTECANLAGREKIGTAEFENSTWASWLEICA